MKMNKSAGIFRFFSSRIVSQNGNEHPEQNKTLNKAVLAWLILLMSSFATLNAQAAIHYVSQGATGSGNGNDWTNAYKSLPSTLVRGDTYYIAAGNYPAYTFDAPVSGSTAITIKKATPSDHGTETGWQSSYGTNQAVFNSVLWFKTGYYTFDGQVRNESDWFDGAAYGFKIDHNNQDQNIRIADRDYGKAASGVVIKNTYVNAIVGNLPSNTIRRYAIDTDTYGGAINTGLVFSKMFINGSNNVWFLRTTEGAVVEYSASSYARNNAANHGEVWNLFYSGNNAVIRYNKVKNAYEDNAPVNGGTALVAITQADGVQFYGNVAWDFAVGDGVVGFDGYSSSHNRVYNNTFIRSVGYNAGTAWGTGTDNLTYNNLFINCNSVSLAGTHDYNGFSGSNASGESHAQLNIPTSLFTNYSGNDFTLKSDTTTGLNLSSPYNVDLMGNMRGSSGTWSIGAFEFVSGQLATLQPPSNLRIQ